VKAYLLAVGLAATILFACTFRIEPVIEVNDASIQFGPIQVCFDAGGQ